MNIKFQTEIEIIFLIFIFNLIIIFNFIYNIKKFAMEIKKIKIFLLIGKALK